MIDTRNGRFPRKHVDETRLRTMWLAGVPVLEMGRQLGVSKTFVSKRAHRIGLPRRIGTTATLPGNAIERAYVQHGMTADEIADQLGTNDTSIVRVLRSRGVQMRPAGVRCLNMQAECVACVKLFRAGLSMQQVALRTGLSRNQTRHRIRKVLGPQFQGTPPEVPSEQLVAWRDAGMTLTAIAKRIGRCAETVRTRIARARRRAGETAA